MSTSYIIDPTTRKIYPSLINGQRDFTINVQYKAPPETPYDIIYMKGLLSLPDRAKVDGLLDYIRNSQETKIYRPSDPYFGVANDIRYQHQYGVKSVSDILYFFCTSAIVPPPAK